MKDVSQVHAGSASSPIVSSTDELNRSASASTTLVKSSEHEQTEPCSKLAQKENLEPATPSTDASDSLVRESKKQVNVQHQVDVSDNEVICKKSIYTATSECLSTKHHSVEGGSAKSVLAPEIQVTESRNTSNSTALIEDNIEYDAEDITVAVEDHAVSCSESKTAVDLNLGSKYVDSGEDADKAVGPQTGDAVEEDGAAGGLGSSEKAKDVGSSEKVKVMEEEMMSLLNLFFTDSEQKKSSQSEQNVDEAGKENLAAEPGSNVCEVMVVTGDEDVAATTSASAYGKVQLVTNMNANDKADGDVQNQNDNAAEAHVHILPVGSTVLLLDKDSSVTADADAGAEVKHPEVSMPQVSTQCSDSITTTEEKSNSTLKQIHFLVKTSKNKVLVSSSLFSSVIQGDI